MSRWRRFLRALEILNAYMNDTPPRPRRPYNMVAEWERRERWFITHCEAQAIVHATVFDAFVESTRVAAQIEEN